VSAAPAPSPAAGTRASRSTRYQALRLAAGLVVGGLLFWLALREVAWDDFLSMMRGARWGWLAMCWMAIVAAPLVKGLRWRYLLAAHPRRPDWLRLTEMFAVGQLANVVIPARAGEITRCYLAGRGTPGGFALVLGTIVIEKVLDGVALLAIAAGLALSTAIPDWFGTAALSFAATMGLLLAALVALVLAHDPLLRFAKRFPPRLRNLAEAGLDGIGALRERGVLLPALAATAAVWLLGVASNYALFVALGLPVSWAAALLLIVVHYLAVLIPGVPAQVGLFHYVTRLALAVFGVDAALATPYAVVLHGLIYGTIILTGVLAAPALSIRPADLARLERPVAGEGP